MVIRLTSIIIMILIMIIIMTIMMIVMIIRFEWGAEADAVLGPIFDNEVPMTQEEIVPITPSTLPALQAGSMSPMTPDKRIKLLNQGTVISSIVYPNPDR